MALALRPRPTAPSADRAWRLPLSARARAALAAALLCLGAAAWLGGSRIGPYAAAARVAAEPTAPGVATADPSGPAPGPAPRAVAAGVAPGPATPGTASRPTERSQVREAVAQRIDALHRRLRIVPAEQALWDQFADTMLRNALDSEGRFRSRPSQSALGAAEGLAARAEAAQARADMLGHLSASFRALYEAMPPDQRLLADQVFRQAQRQEGRRGPSRMQQD
jgi:hypothetical protein